MSFPNVLITAQQGFFTKEALTHIASITYKMLKSLQIAEIQVYRQHYWRNKI